MPITLHHVALAGPQADEAVSFYTKDWGLRETGRDESSVRLAAADYPGDDYSLVIIESDRKTVDHFCLISDDAGLIGQIRERVAANGVKVLDDVRSCPGVENVLHVVDLDGRHIEIGYRPASGPSDEPSENLPHKPAHIVLNTPDIDAITDWYQEKLGFGLRDWREHQMSFLYYNTDHHTVAFSKAPHASLNHVAWEIADLNQFFRAVSRLSDSPTADKLYGPGRHGPGEYVFCYFVDPLGFICEYETDAIKVQDPADYEFRVHKWSPESSDAWLGVLSGGMPDRFREVARNEPDAGWLAALAQA
ncbi:MAG: VOC family protein [Streptosporangiaceae bacterium]|jgi:catechol 2,3-dioxygenase-like lactoylglutathione lyase family enzyme